MQLLEIIQHEWRLFNRNKVLTILLITVLILSAFTLGQAWMNYEQVRQSRHEAGEHMRQRFLNQGAVNPHSAAHYGHVVFKPLSALTMVDDGVNAYTGVTLRLEAHQQNEIAFSPAQGSGSLIRFGVLKLGMVLQVIFPLLIIFACYNAVSREREAGTLSLAITQGGSMRRLVWGKTIAYFLIWLSVTIVLMISVSLLAKDSESHWPRVLLLTGVYALYFFIVTAVSVYISAKSKSSSSALLTLITLWILATVLLPKASANLGDNLTPLTTKIEMEQAINNDNKKGINGHDPSNERSRRFRDSVMQAYHANTVTELSINMDGLTMQADEEYHNKVYDRHFGNVRDAIARQNDITSLTSFINPFIPTRNLSMAISNTDIYSHVEFTQQAEQYRRKIIKIMNDEMAYGGSKTGDWDWAVKADYWNAIEDFSYNTQTVSSSLAPYTAEVTALVFWLLAVISLIQFTTNRIKLTT